MLLRGAALAFVPRDHSDASWAMSEHPVQEAEPLLMERKSQRESGTQREYRLCYLPPRSVFPSSSRSSTKKS